MPQCCQKYATAISPEAMNAAMRVKTPTVISNPSTSSIRPANQNGQVPTGIAAPSGQPNSFIVPCSVNSSPNTMRKMLNTGEE